MGEVTADGEFGLLPIVCLGHCEMAPCLLANEKVYGPLGTDAASVTALLQRIRDDRRPAQG
jgi:NADH:ubiquinone oxidoreductase subunit E